MLLKRGLNFGKLSTNHYRFWRISVLPNLVRKGQLLQYPFQTIVLAFEYDKSWPIKTARQFRHNIKGELAVGPLKSTICQKA